MKFKSKIGKIFELTQERKKHIFEFHPDIKEYFSKIPRVLKEPNQIRESKHDSKVLLFYKYFANIKGGKYLAVVVKINRRNFILTSYLTDKTITGKKIYEKE